MLYHPVPVGTSSDVWTVVQLTDIASILARSSLTRFSSLSTKARKSLPLRLGSQPEISTVSLCP